ncbi:hypothetical protein AALP_AAs44506U000100 [Arabis alpina]|nr:hypothetical protein AALP_AAs44506U000100 [Arabis alpina]
MTAHVSADQLCPPPPSLADGGDSFSRKLVLMQSVELFENGGWWKGIVNAVKLDDMVSVLMLNSQQTRDVAANELRIHREWVNGAWDLPEELQRDTMDHTSSPQNQNDEVDEGSPSHNTSPNHSSSNQDEQNIEKPNDIMDDTSHPLSSNVEQNVEIDSEKEKTSSKDPSPQKHDANEKEEIEGDKNTSSSKDQNVEHVDEILLLLAMRREKDVAYFHNNRLPKAMFLPTSFFKHLAVQHIRFKTAKNPERFVFDEELIKIARGGDGPVGFPKKRWIADTDVIYGAVLLRKGRKHWFGMAIDLKKRKIRILECENPYDTVDFISSHVQPLAVMFPFLLTAFREEEKDVKVDHTPFKVERIEKKRTPTTAMADNCGLFTMKMIECHSMGINDMSKLVDEDVEDYRTRMSSEIFEEFYTP